MKLLKFDNLHEAEQAMREIKTDNIELMASKSIFKVVKMENVPQEKANIVKEEMLKAGGDAAISVDAWNKKECTTDVIVFGTLKQFEEFFERLDRKDMFSYSKQIRNLIVY